MQGAGKVARVGGSVVHQLRDFFDIIYFDDAMVFQSQGNRARHECDRSEVLTKSIVQFLPEALLFAIADFKNFAFKAFAPGDLGFNSSFALRNSRVRSRTRCSSRFFDFSSAASACLRSMMTLAVRVKISPARLSCGAGSRGSAIVVANVPSTLPVEEKSVWTNRRECPAVKQSAANAANCSLAATSPTATR